MNELPADVDRVLHAERGNVPAAPLGARERVLARVQATVGTAGAVPMPVMPPAAPLGATPGVSASTKWAMALLLGLGLPSVTYLAVRTGPPAVAARPAVPPPAVEAPPLPVAAEPAAPVLAGTGAVGAAAPTPPRERRPRARPAVSDPAMSGPLLPSRDAGEGALAAERTLLESARTALALGHTGEALALARRHQHRFATGQLVEERESIVIRALVTAGQAGAARDRAATFRQRFPRSMFLPAVDAVLQQLDP